MDTLGQRLKTARLVRCLSQQQLAAESGIPQTSLSNIEVGRFVPSESYRREDLASALHIRLEWLLNGSGLPFTSSEQGRIEILNPCRKREPEQAGIELITSVEHNLNRFYYDKHARFFAAEITLKIFYVLLLGTMTPERKIQEYLNTLQTNNFADVTLKNVSIIAAVQQAKVKHFKIGDAFTLKYLERYFSEFMYKGVSADSGLLMDSGLPFKPGLSLIDEARPYLNDPKFAKKLHALIKEFKKK